MAVISSQASGLVSVNRYTAGLVGPSLEMDQTVQDGGRIQTISPPGCWGPMITPQFNGGHEVSWPVSVEGAKVGDAIAITIERVHVRSLATSSGTMITKEAALGSDPFVDHKCPSCGPLWPKSRPARTGHAAVRRAACRPDCRPLAS